MSSSVALPYWQFLPWAAQNGLKLPLFVQQLFADRIGAFFGMDVLVSAVALLVFVRFENSRTSIPGSWLPLIAVSHRRRLTRLAAFPLPA